MNPRSYRWIGLSIGLSMALFDFWALSLVEGWLALDQSALWRAVMLLFVATFATLGYALGRLIEARRSATADAALIRAQLEALEASKRQLVDYETLASIGRLAAGVAHEVRNPLAVIRGAASLLCERLPSDDPDAQRASHFIREEVDRLDDFVATLLDFSRPLVARRERVPMADVFERVELLSAHALRAAKCALSTDTGDVESFSLDRDPVAQALAALVVNAAEAIADVDPERRPADQGTIRISARRIAGGVTITIADDGPGIDPDLRERVLDPFVTTRARGTGLGLPMSARILRAHGGDLEIGGEGLGPAGRGACVVATIPEVKT